MSDTTDLDERGKRHAPLVVMALHLALKGEAGPHVQELARNTIQIAVLEGIVEWTKNPDSKAELLGLFITHPTAAASLEQLRLAFREWLAPETWP